MDGKNKSILSKYNPMIWEIVKIWEPTKYFLFGEKEEIYYPVRLEYHKEGYTPSGVAGAYLREVTFQLVMKYFGVTKPSQLIGKEFRANVNRDAQAALLILALKAEHPDLV